METTIRKAFWAKVPRTMGGRPEIRRGPQAAGECLFFSASSRSEQGSTELLLVVSEAVSKSSKNCSGYGIEAHHSRKGVCANVPSKRNTKNKKK